MAVEQSEHLSHIKLGNPELVVGETMSMKILETETGAN
jgi:hypothetical protein